MEDFITGKDLFNSKAILFWEGNSLRCSLKNILDEYEEKGRVHFKYQGGVYEFEKPEDKSLAYIKKKLKTNFYENINPTQKAKNLQIEWNNMTAEIFAQWLTFTRVKEDLGDPTYKNQILKLDKLVKKEPKLKKFLINILDEAERNIQ